TRFSRDWSSDVCSSDLTSNCRSNIMTRPKIMARFVISGSASTRRATSNPLSYWLFQNILRGRWQNGSTSPKVFLLFRYQDHLLKIGRASCRERAYIMVV